MVCPHQNSCGLLDLSVGMLETGACWEVAVRERLCKASAAKMSECLSLGEGSECVITHGDWLSYLTVTASKGCQVLHVLYTLLLFLLSAAIGSNMRSSPGANQMWASWNWASQPVKPLA